jgi:rhamnogalacturonyl hydrolase YesR
VLAAYRKMMATLLSHQAQNGMWRQLIDHPESWEETSSSAMFTYAFVTGVKNGWLAEETYGPAARKAWIALVGYLTPEGLLREVCVGTGKKNDLQVLPGPPARWAIRMARRPCCGALQPVEMKDSDS